MASSGMNVIMVIHQPRYTLYELFDSLLLLGVGGVTVYNGPPLLTERWFSKNGFKMPPYDNMADFNLDVISGKVIRSILPCEHVTLQCASLIQEDHDDPCAARVRVTRVALWLPELPAAAGQAVSARRCRLGSSRAHLAVEPPGSSRAARRL
jgi:hypothetical protein